MFFRVSRPCVVLLQRQRPSEVEEKSDSPLLFSHSEDSAAEHFCCGRSFLKALEGEKKKRTQNKISEQPLLSQGGAFQRSQCPFTHQFTLISTLHSCLCTRSFAQKPRHKSTTDWIQHQEKSKSPFSYERSSNNCCSRSFFLTHLFVLLDTVWFPSLSLVCIWCRSKRGTFHKESVCKSQRSIESADKIYK